MLKITIGLAVVLLIIAVPQLRRAALSLLALFAIIAFGSAAFAGVIWALYESKPWLVPDDRGVAQKTSTPAQKAAEESIGTAEADLASALADEEEQHVNDERQRLEEERLRIEITAARARVVLEEDRQLAAQAAAFPLPAGVGDELGDIMAIRIPAWRDKEVAVAQKESIRTWLQSIGLAAEETASIVTAKAWGSLYDMWVAENPDAAPPGSQVGEAEEGESTLSDARPSAEGEPLADQEPSPTSELANEPPPFVGQIPPRRQVTNPGSQRRAEAPRRPPPARPAPRQREVGPFGY